MTVLRVLSTALICIAGRPAPSIAAGVQEVIEETMRGAIVGRALQSAGRMLMIACRIAGSLKISIRAIREWTDVLCRIHLSDQLRPQHVCLFVELIETERTTRRDHIDIWVDRLPFCL
jgi:hypothetical protein